MQWRRRRKVNEMGTADSKHLPEVKINTKMRVARRWKGRGALRGRPLRGWVGEKEWYGQRALVVPLSTPVQ